MLASRPSSVTPLRTISITCSAVNPARMATDTPGWAPVKRAIAVASGSTACEGMAAISTRPVVSPSTDSTAERASAIPCATSRAGPISARPASVSTTPRPTRWNSSEPRSRSSSLIDCDSDGWAT